MFCPKCGTKVLDGAVFCQKCGAKLILDDSAAQPAVELPANSANQSGNTPKQAPVKKKSKKLPIIIGVAVLVVLAVIFIAMNWEGKTDYEATIRAHAPFANSQGLPYTYGEVFDKYIPNAKWEVWESDDVAHVDITGKAKGADAEMVITIKVSLDEKDTDLAFISPESVSVSGNKSPTEDEAVRFLLAMFIAYDEEDEDLSNFSERLDDIGLTTQGDVSLTETFTDADLGISFQYPAGWTFNDMVDYGVEDESGISMVCLIYDSNSSAQIAVQKITNPRLIDSVFSDDSEFLNTFGYNFDAINSINTSIEELHEVPMRKISYVVSLADYETAHQAYIYVAKNALYRIQFTCKSDEMESQLHIFEAIIGSYSITDTAGTHLDDAPTPDLSSAKVPLATSTDAMELFNEWAAAHPMAGTCHLNLISDDTTDSRGEKAFLFTLETDGMGVFNITIRKSDGYMEYISKFDTISLDDWYKDWFSDGSTSDILCYKGVPLMDWFEYSPEEIYGISGQPDYGTPVTGELLYGGTEFFGYTDAIAFEVYSGSISSVRVASGGVEINGTTLDKTRAEIVELLGEAFYEDNYYDESGDFRDCYFMQYVYGGGGTILRIEFPDSNSVADSIQIFRYTDGI